MLSSAFAGNLDEPFIYFSWDGLDGSDDSVQGTDLTSNGDPTFPASGCKVGAGCAYLDGVGDYFTMADTSNFPIGASDRGFCTWFKEDTGVSTDTVLWSYGIESTYRAVDIRIQTGNTVGMNPYFGAFATTTAIANDDWEHICYTYEESINEHNIYINGVSEKTTTSPTLDTGSASSFRIGNYHTVDAGLAKGHYDEFVGYDFTLTPEQVSTLYASDAGFNPLPATRNVTIRVNDLWDNSALSDLNVTVTYANATTVLYQNATGNQIYTDIPQNATLSVDLTYSSTNYFSKTVENVNLESDITGTLFQTETRFNASELFNNITVEGNFTIFNGTVNITKASNEIFNLNQNNYTVYFESDGYFNKSQDFEIFALTNSTETITDVFNSNLTISGINLFDNSTITNFSFTIFNENMSQSYTNVNESKNIYPFQSGLYNITATAPGFFDVNQSNISISAGIETYSIGFQQEGALAFFIRDIDTGDLISGSNTTVIFNNATTELQFSTISGIGSIEGLIVNNTYDVVIANSLYERSFTGFTYIQDVEQYDFYLTPNGTEINFNIVSVENKAISGALVQIETFVNGLPVLVQSAFTDVRGFTRFILPVDKTYFVTVTQSEYQGVEDILINFNNPDIKIVLQSLDGALDTTGTEGIRYSLTPKMTVLESNQTINWVYSVFSSDSQLESFSLGLYNGTTLLSFIDSTNTSGGTLNLSLNLTSPLYDEAKIRAVITYKKIDEDLQTLTRIYSITQNINYDGSLLELRDWMQENIGDMDRFIIFVLAFFTVMIVTAIFIKGFANVIISVLMAFIIGWLVGMNLFLIISIGSILLLGMIAWSNEIR